MKVAILVVVVALSSYSASAQQMRKDSSNLSSQDRTFMTGAAAGGLAEVAMGHVAVQHGSSSAVRKFGNRMVKDHSLANKELMRVAKSVQIKLPTSMGAKELSELSDLRSLSGSAFDAKYGHMMIEDHKKDVSEFEKEAKIGSNPRVVAFAKRILPTLRKHLQMARVLSK
jgi:putative membrane protein